MYILKRVPDGAYVAKKGSRGSYTPYLQRARVFATIEEADRNRCVENEVIVSIESEINQ